MDVQTESTDPPPCESQSSGKIRKGFKLFGKRKPGNIFTIRNKGDGNNKSPVSKSKSLDGLSENGEPDLVQEPDRYRGQEVSQEEMEPREEEAPGEGGIQALGRTRNSISSTSSARSLKFLSLLRGGRRGTGDRQVHTVSQPVGRQRRGLKGLFGTVRLKSKDKEAAPPSPLLKSSRANSVEIIKEDLTLTPKVQPRSLDSPEKENTEPVSSQDSTPSSPSQTADSRVTADSVSMANEHVPPVPTSQPPLEPGDNSLSNLLADISSLLTFESISGGGDVMANVEAEWGKAHATSKPTSPVYKPSIPPSLTSTTARNATVAKASPVDVTMTTKTSAPPAQATSSTTTVAAPSTISTTTKASTLATSSGTLSSGFTANLSTSTSVIKTSPTLAARKLSSAHVTAESVSSTSSSPLLTKSTLSAASTTTPAVPPKTPAAPVKCPSFSPAVTFTVSMLPSETVVPPQLLPLVMKPSQVTTPPPDLPPVTHRPPSPVAFHQPSSDKLDFVTTPKLQTSTTRSAGGESTEPAAAAATTACAISTPYFQPLASKMAMLSSSTATVSASVSKPTLPSAGMDSNQTPTSLAALSQVCPPFQSSTYKSQPSPSPVSAPPSAPLTEIPARTEANTQLSLDEVAPAAAVKETPASTAPAQNQTPQFRSTFGQGQTADVVAKDPPVQTLASDAKERPAQIESVQAKLSFDVDQIPTEDPPALKTNKDILVSLSTVSPAADSESAVTPAPLSASGPSPVSSLSSPSWPSEAPSKIVGSRRVSVDGQVSSFTSKEPPRAQAVPSKKDEEHNEPQMGLQGPLKEGKTQHPKPSGLSKIPVVGGGRVGKLPVREGQHVDTEAVREPPTPEAEKERPHFNSHDAGSRDQSFDATSPVGLTSKRTQEKSQQLPQPKVLTSSPRDSKIPMKHSPQSNTASQIPVARDTPRTKIPVSRVPVRRVANKPAAAYGSSQIRK